MYTIEHDLEFPIISNVLTYCSLFERENRQPKSLELIGRDSSRNCGQWNH